MKKTLFFLFALSVLNFCSCEKEKEVTDGTFVFYRTGPANATWHVLIEGNDYGMVPYSNIVPTCNDNAGLKVKLKPGTYTVDFKSMDGYAWGSPREVVITSGQCLVYKQ